MRTKGAEPPSGLTKGLSTKTMKAASRATARDKISRESTTMIFKIYDKASAVLPSWRPRKPIIPAFWKSTPCSQPVYSSLSHLAKKSKKSRGKYKVVAYFSF